MDYTKLIRSNMTKSEQYKLAQEVISDVKKERERTDAFYSGISTALKDPVRSVQTWLRDQRKIAAKYYDADRARRYFSRGLGLAPFINPNVAIQAQRIVGGRPRPYTFRRRLWWRRPWNPTRFYYPRRRFYYNRYRSRRRFNRY